MKKNHFQFYSETHHSSARDPTVQFFSVFIIWYKTVNHATKFVFQRFIFLLLKGHCTAGGAHHSCTSESYLRSPLGSIMGGWDRLDEVHLLGRVCMQTASEWGSEGEGALHNARPLPFFTHVQHVTETRKTPQSKIYASQDVLLYLYLSHTHTHADTLTQLLTPTVRLWKSLLFLPSQSVWKMHIGVTHRTE